jgi:hypothetical protein
MFLTYLKYRDSIKKESLQVEVSKQLRIHGAEHSDLECECFEWFIHARPNNTPVERPTVKEKANEITLMMGIKFQYLNGWL